MRTVTCIYHTLRVKDKWKIVSVQEEWEVDTTDIIFEYECFVLLFELSDFNSNAGVNHHHSERLRLNEIKIRAKKNRHRSVDHAQGFELT